MVALNWEINAGTVVPIVLFVVGGVAGVIRRIQATESRTVTRMHVAEVMTEKRHADNTGKFALLEESHKDLKCDIQTLNVTQKECQTKITETREMVIRLDEANKRQRSN